MCRSSPCDIPKLVSCLARQHLRFRHVYSTKSHHSGWLIIVLFAFDDGVNLGKLCVAEVWKRSNIRSLASCQHEIMSLLSSTYYLAMLVMVNNY